MWSALVARFEALDVIYDGLATQAAFRKFVTSIIKPVFQRTGFSSAAGESANTRILRSTLLSTLGQFNDPAVVGEAREKFSAYLKDPSALSGSDRDSVLTIVAVNADPGVWDELHALARSVPTQLEKNQCYGLMASARDPVLAQRALDLALTDEADVTLRPRIIGGVSSLHPEMAFDFAVAHWDALSPLIEPSTQMRYIPRLASNASETAILDRLNAFASIHIPATADMDLRKAVSQIRYIAAIRTDRLPSIDAWLAARGGATGQ